MVKSGKFTCPKCGRNKIKEWLEWQNKDDKQIFYWQGEWKGTNYNNWYSKFYDGYGVGSSNDCWKKGGSTIEQWNNWDKEWKCDYCSFKSNTFLDFTQLEAKHICPYGCERMIPDKYHGCTELLRDFPNYVFD